jgi:hypothetical protein
MQEHNTTHVMRRMTRLLPKATFYFKHNCLPEMAIDPSQLFWRRRFGLPLRLFY